MGGERGSRVEAHRFTPPSPEVFHQHQVVDGGVRPGIENRAAVGRSSETKPNLAEVTATVVDLPLAESKN